MSDTRHGGPCGQTITHTTVDGMTDDHGHPVTFVHSRYLSRLETGFGAVRYMHRQDPEGIIPSCVHDGEPYPCSTMRMLDPSTVPLPGGVS